MITLPEGHRHFTFAVDAGSSTLVEAIQSASSLASMVAHVLCVVGLSTTDLSPLAALTRLGSLRLDGYLDVGIPPEVIG